MTDRELLKLAAKAAGYNMAKVLDGYPMYMEGYGIWNPLTDDGDALRLAVACGLIVDCSRPSAGEPYKQHAIWRDETMSNAELTRRAIVRAAAEIGSGME
jgi:hypothetical protein